MSGRTEAIELHIPNQLGFERIAMSAATAAARMMKFSDDRIEDLKTAVSEACLNAIEHGTKGRKTTGVLVTLKVGKSRLEVNVQNRGGRFKKDAGKPDIHAKVRGESPPRGWGMFLIKSLVDKVEFKSTPKKGNITRMIIYIHGVKSKNRQIAKGV